MNKTIMVTGSRNWSRDASEDYSLITRGMGIEIKSLVDQGATEITVRQGSAKGADAMVVEFVNKIERTLLSHGVKIKHKAYPPNFAKHGSPAAYHVRNQQMVDDGADVCVAFLKPGEPNRGTLSTMAKARAAGIKVSVYGALELDKQPT
jgi:hypothetical protein